MLYKTIDNFLPTDQADIIEEVFLGYHPNWQYNQTVADNNDTSGVYFSCNFISELGSSLIVSPKCIRGIGYIFDSLEKHNLLNEYDIVRARANLYTQTDKIIEHAYHRDDKRNHVSVIYSINTNNGYTRVIIDDKIIKIESIKNRILIIDGQLKHASSTCTDEKVRVNLNFNFFSKWL